MKRIQQVCVWICIASVVLAVPFVLTMLWTGGWNSQTMLYLKTLAVFFVASAAILSVVRMAIPRPPGDAE